MKGCGLFMFNKFIGELKEVNWWSVLPIGTEFEVIIIASYIILIL